MAILVVKDDTHKLLREDALNILHVFLTKEIKTCQPFGVRAVLWTQRSNRSRQNTMSESTLILSAERVWTLSSREADVN
jgi:hypothetical protein